MYFPFGWPKYLGAHLGQETNFTDRNIKCVCSNRDRSLFAVLSDDGISIWYAKPTVQVVSHYRTTESLASLGINEVAEWKPDSTMLVVTTSESHLLFYQLGVDESIKGLYEQHDSHISSLKRDSAELFIKEKIPPLVFSLAFTTFLPGKITGLACIRDEMMVATATSQVWRLRWDGKLNEEFCWNLYNIPFSVDQQLSRAFLLEEPNICVESLEYSPLIGGFSVVLSNGKAAFITAPTLKFDPSKIQGVWASEVNNATCTSVNHRYRLTVYGLKNSEGVVYNIDDLTGALVLTHRLVLSSKDFPDIVTAAGGVRCMRWSPDGVALAMGWEKGGIALWSVFGALLMCTLGWDYGLTDVLKNNPFKVTSLDWGVEGYHLWMVTNSAGNESNQSDCPKVAQLQFAKSALTVNAGMTGREHVFLQAEDRLFIGAGSDLVNQMQGGTKRSKMGFLPLNLDNSNGNVEDEESYSTVDSDIQARLVGNKQWVVVPIPYTYLGNNWPVRYSTIDSGGQHIAVAGQTGLAHYSLPLKKWKLFGNETQEQDFVVMGGLLWWQDNIIVGCYNLRDNRDEIRVYPKEAKLDNQFVHITRVANQVLQLSLLGDRLLSFCADSHLTLFQLQKKSSPLPRLQLARILELDVSSLVIHPACVVSATLTSLRTEAGKRVDSILMNVCGRLFLLQQDPAQKSLDSKNNNQGTPLFSAPTVLASSVENVWVSSRTSRHTPHLTEALWIHCGAHGMRVWLPLFPRDGENSRSHNFMSKRIMLPIQVPIYPLAVLFEETMVLGAENDTLFCSVDNNLQSPLSIISRSSQVYLHHILRQLLRRNLGYHAWEIARSCSNLSYFAHSLELLLHEVLEEEATSSEPIPDALLPRVIDFIKEFPVYLQTIVQCARKTELALWPHLFSAVGNPRDLFQECLHHNLLETAASYLIILQSLENSAVSRHLATLLLDATLDNAKWELSKELVRFLRAIDPNDVESPPRAVLSNTTKFSIAHAASPTEEDLSLIMGTVSITRGRSFSSGGPTTLNLAKVSAVTATEGPGGAQSIHRDLGRLKSEPKNIPPKRKDSIDITSAEEFFIDTILTRHAKKLLAIGRLRDLGFFAAHLDFHLITFFRKEKSRVAQIDDYILALRTLHHDFQWPFPMLPISCSTNIPRKDSATGSIDENVKPLVDGIHSNIDPTILKNNQIRDSGYLSNGTIGNSIRGISEANFSQPIEAHLLPRRSPENESLLTLEMSEGSSLWGEESSHTTLEENSSWASLPLSADLEAITLELASRGPPQSEVQLRYLLQLLLEAGCLEWALLVSVVLRDTMAVVRVVNASQQIDLPNDTVQRLRTALASLDRWANSECLGYKTFMLSIRNQVKALTRLSLAKRQMLKLHSQSSADNSNENSLSQDDLDDEEDVDENKDDQDASFKTSTTSSDPIPAEDNTDQGSSIAENPVFRDDEEDAKDLSSDDSTGKELDAGKHEKEGRGSECAIS